MAARASYPSIVKAFERITVDGMNLSGLDYYRIVDKLREKRRTDWHSEVLNTLLHLVLKRGGLPATTSGTTGPPKRFNIPRRDLVLSARLTGATFDLRPGDRVLHCLPSEFIAGKMMLVRAFALGLDIHLIDPRGSVLDNLEVQDQFRFVAMVPLQLHRAIQQDRARVERQFGTILLGGGPVSEALMEDTRTLDARVFQSYGSTETVTHVALRPLNGPAQEDHFTALGACHFARDPRGCLVVYTPHLTTEQHVTNDLVELIDDTRFRWLGRIDNVILSGGKKIFPEQLEAKTAGAIPYPHYFTHVPDPVLGQAVMLVLETERPQEEVMPEVLEKVMEVLHPHEWPRRVQALRRIARTESGKVIRAR
ncbi:MAG: AMP-binding protein [Flavobacteriales bacterium]|jgi:O-succinylbenzoic acid--CoA ligase|nr:AMP-binding protein [Flavobacteriales bacterium]